MAHTRPVYCIPAPPPLAEGVSAGIACTKAPATHAPGASHRTLFLMLTLAPPSISALAAPSWSLRAAKWRGVLPKMSALSTLALAFTSSLMLPSWPLPAAQWRGVRPYCQQHRARQPCGVVRRVRVGGCVGVGVGVDAGEGANVYMYTYIYICVHIYR